MRRACASRCARGAGARAKRARLSALRCGARHLPEEVARPRPGLYAIALPWGEGLGGGYLLIFIDRRTLTPSRRFAPTSPLGAGQPHMGFFWSQLARMESRTTLLRHFRILLAPLAHDWNRKFPYAIAPPSRGGQEGSNREREEWRWPRWPAIAAIQACRRGADLRRFSARRLPVSASCALAAG